MKQHQLRALVAVADFGSVRAGARALSLSQTALTKAILELEADLHAQLLHRNAKGAQLTSIGLELVERARLILAEIDNARAHVERFRGRTNERVSAAASPAFFRRFLPQIVGRFRSRFPDAQLNIQDVFLSQTLPKLRDGSIDVAFTSILPECLGNDISFEPLGSVDLALIARRHAFPPRIDSLSQLEHEHWVLDASPCGVSEVLRREFRKLGCSVPQRITECSSALSTLALVEDCGCITPTPKIVLGSKWFSSDIVELELHNPLPAMPCGLLLRRDAKLSPAVQWMCECLRAATTLPEWAAKP